MRTFAGLLAAIAFSAGTASAADNTCVRLSQIDESPIVDDGTILLKLKNGDFKRIDLRGRCPSLKMSGFAHKTPSDDLCTSTVLTVRSPGRADCMIERIVDIDRTEADTLMKKQ
jgi:hypothetical protein